MTVESVTYITDFNSTYPAGGDAPSEGDNHIRNIKIGVGGTFPNFAGIAMTATEAELNTLDGITATTAELNILDGVTSTAAELNILDGVTATASELNTTDASLQAVTGFTYGNMHYIDDDGDSQAGTTFDVAAVIGAAWESMGPTGSGATNIWTALNALPSGTKWIEVGISVASTDSAGAAQASLYARRNGASSAVGFLTEVALVTSFATGTVTGANIVSAKIPVTSRKFDLYFNGSGDTTNACSLRLIGFGV